MPTRIHLHVALNGVPDDPGFFTGGASSATPKLTLLSSSDRDSVVPFADPDDDLVGLMEDDPL